MDKPDALVNPTTLLEAVTRAFGMKLGSVQGFVLCVDFGDGASGLVHNAATELDALDFANSVFITKLRRDGVTAEPQR